MRKRADLRLLAGAVRAEDDDGVSDRGMASGCQRRSSAVDVFGGSGLEPVPEGCLRFGPYWSTCRYWTFCAPMLRVTKQVAG